LAARVAVAAFLLVLIVAGIALFYLGGSEAEPVAVRAATIRTGISLLDVVEAYPAAIEGLPVSLEVVRLGAPPQVVDALVQGDVDIAILPVELGAKAIALGADAYIIALDYEMNQAILARPDSGITSPADLKGKRVAAVVGSGTYAIFKALMEEVYGLTVGEGDGYDIVIVALQPPQVVDALVQGDVDAAVIWEPLVSQAIVQHGMVVVADLASVWREYVGDPNAPAPMLAWVASARIVEDKMVLDAVLEAHRRAAEKWVNDREWTVQLLVNLYGLSPDVAESVWDRSKVYTSTCIDEETAEYIVRVWELAVKAGYIGEAPSPERIVVCARG